MNTQTSLDFGRQRRDDGMNRAVTHANKIHSDWSDKAYAYLIQFVASRKPGETFLTEDIREDAGTVVPEPPSLRSWGAITMRAAREGLIVKVGHRAVKNKNANMAYASVWRRV